MGRGAEEDFHRFVESCGPDMARFARLLVAHPQDTDDLLQASLLRVWRSWDRVAEAGDRMRYVRRTMVNAAISWGQRRDRAVLSHPVPEPQGADGTQSVADRLSLADAIRSLAPRQRCAVVLRYYCDLDDASIAEVLGCSPSTVRSQIHRALAHLRVVERADPVPAQAPQPPSASPHRPPHGSPQGDSPHRSQEHPPRRRTPGSEIPR